jgi:hypothetical protein
MELYQAQGADLLCFSSISNSTATPSDLLMGLNLRQNKQTLEHGLRVSHVIALPAVSSVLSSD